MESLLQERQGTAWVSSKKIYDKSSAVAEIGDRGHKIDMGRKERGCSAQFAETWDPVIQYVAWAKVYFRTKWCPHPSSRVATRDMKWKLNFYAERPETTRIRWNNAK